MKRFKKLVSVAMASAMVLAMAGCGNNDANANSNAAGGSSAQNSSAAVENSSATPDNTNTEGGVFKIGGIGPTTGGAAIYGINVMNGIQLAVNEINAAGGVNGYQLEVNFQDDEHDPEKWINAYDTVKD